MTTKFESYLVSDFDTSSNGNKAVGVPITIFIAGTRDKAIIYDDDQKQITNPVITENSGKYSFNLSPGVYDLVSDADTDKEFYLYTNYSIGGIENIEFDTEVKEFPPFEGTLLQLDRDAVYVQVEKDGRVLPPSQYSFTPPSNEITLNEASKLSNRFVVRDVFVGSGKLRSPVGYISDYLTTGTDFSTALENCCADNYIVDFEGLTLTTAVTPTISANAKCRIWRMNGAKLKFMSGEVEFNNQMNEIGGEGEIHLGLKLAKIAQDGTKDATSITVYNSTTEQGAMDFVVGDYVATSLDNDYLPNSPSRVGYIENGDFNRITSINDNGDGTSTINLTYTFLRSSDPNVSTGVIQNAWIGNPNFQIRGLRFIGNKDNHLLIDQTVITNPRGYYIDLDNGAGDLRKATATLNMPIHNTFIDMVRFRAFGIEFGPQYYATRQYDFSKQHLVCDIPADGYIVYKSGCICERQNRDGEVFNTPFVSGQTVVERGKVVVEAGAYFDGSQPSDLPTSDFSPGGQVYWGKLVAISDALHFEVPNAANSVTGGMYFAGRVKGYMRSITGTSFAGKDSYVMGKVVFDGAELSCEPAYVEINGGVTRSFANENFKVISNGCQIYSRGLNNYDGGCYHIDTGSNIILTPEAAASPQIDGSQTFNYVTKIGGMLSGRYAISGSDTSLKEVNIPYQGTAKPDQVLIFGDGFIPNENDLHLVLMPPADGSFEGGGDFVDYDQTVPINAWFASNATSFRASPPNLNFKFLGVEFPGTFNYGSVSGFSRRYTARIPSTFSNGNINPFPTGGIWSGLLESDDLAFSKVDGEEWQAKSNFQTLLTNAASKDDPTVTVNTAPTNAPTHIGIYSAQFKQWFWYVVTGISGTTVTLGSTYNSTSGVFPDVGHDANSRVSFVRFERKTQSSAGGTIQGCMVENTTGVTLPAQNETTVITFNSELYDDDNFFNSIQSDRLVPSGAQIVNLYGYIEFGDNRIPAESFFDLRIIQYNSANQRVRIAANNGCEIGYQSHRPSTTALGIPVSAGDYFKLEARCNNGSTAASTVARFSIQKVR